MSAELLEYGQWALLDAERIDGDRGVLSPLLPLPGFGATAKRLIIVRDVPEGAVRGGHAHQRARRAVFAAAGSLDAVVGSTADKARGERHRLSAGVGPLVTGPGTWLWLENFSDDGIVIEMFDLPHDPNELVQAGP